MQCDAAASASVASSRGYSFVRSIAQGSFGKVVLVQDREQRLLVMKTIDLGPLDSKQKRDAVNEVKVLSSLRHPYIVSYRESFAENGFLKIVMEYAEGGDLHQRIEKTRKARQSFFEHRIVRWFTEAALGLQYLHGKHLLHRDLKSQNIFLTARERVRIGDFGISKVLAASNNSCNTVSSTTAPEEVSQDRSANAFAKTRVGTPYYLSPEMCLEKPYSFSSDIWALGCVLYELAELEVPFEARTFEGLIQKIAHGPPPQLPPVYSWDLRQLCTDIFRRDPTQRPSADELIKKPLIQKEIRRMLDEEHLRGAVSPSKKGAAAHSPMLSEQHVLKQATPTNKGPPSPITRAKRGLLGAGGGGYCFDSGESISEQALAKSMFRRKGSDTDLAAGDGGRNPQGSPAPANFGARGARPTSTPSELGVLEGCLARTSSRGSVGATRGHSWKPPGWDMCEMRRPSQGAVPGLPCGWANNLKTEKTLLGANHREQSLPRLEPRKGSRPNSPTCHRAHQPFCSGKAA
eukprot:gnl/TRDRNA2_/TRDRNA2_134177_c1_seq1.p1 gnl/TRDRNA2_/TRDRNA2_134177_c1~~gnl/TRDRNA2_/TRDRNA2_134177_c1_seq1.p1  ORF type:complete len:518 (+),score=74.59 gnl/TRDRNA2_/TRDRNA2_134177_c1_seq1:98-1651(+)